MKEKYFSILENLKEGEASEAKPDDKVLIIDGLNTFIRSFAVSPVTNDDGIHVVKEVVREEENYFQIIKQID